MRNSTAAANVTWTECAEPDTGGSGLIGTLLDGEGKCTTTVTVRSPLGLVDYAQLNFVRELGAGLTHTVARARPTGLATHSREPYSGVTRRRSPAPAALRRSRLLRRRGAA